jgi:hypothetical protein
MKNKADIELATSDSTVADSIWNKIRNGSEVYVTLKSIEDSLGKNDSHEGTALNRIKLLEGRAKDIEDVIGVDEKGNVTIWGTINDIQKVFGDWFNSDAFYFIDKDSNVIAFINGDGLTVSNIKMRNGAQGLGYKTDSLGLEIAISDEILSIIE